MKSFLKSFAAVAAVSAAVLCPDPAKANLQTIVDSDTAVWGAVGGDFLNYKESVTPIPNSQHGWLPSFAFGADYMTNSLWYFGGDATVSLGGDNYNGAVWDEDLNGFPDKGKTHQTIVTLNGKVGHGFPIASNVMVTPYADVGYRYWKRNLGDGEREEYHHVETLAGAMLQVSPTDKLVLTGSVEAGLNFGAHMRSYYPTDAGQGSLQYSIGPAAIYKIGGKASYNIAKRFDVFTTLDFKHFRYAQSPLEYDHNDNLYYREPGSFTNETTARVGVAYHFK